MDRIIEKKSFNYKFWLWGIILLSCLIGGIILFRNILKPSLEKKDIVFSTVTRGNLESTFSAVGIVKPISEMTITSPIATKIKSISSENGQHVNKGDLILTLDTEFARLEYARLSDELKLKENNVQRLSLNLNKNIKDIEIDNAIQELEIKNLHSKLLDLKELLKVGGATAEEVKQAESNLQIVELRKKKLENELKYRRASIDSDIENVKIQSTIQRNKLNELGSKINQTNVISPLKGVVTWLNTTIGEQVTTGSPIAKVADLSSYYIEATASDMHAKKINIGQEVQITINNEILNGKIEQILPDMDQGTIKFKVTLDIPDSKLLRPNMKVEISVITAKKMNTLYVLNGRGYKGGKIQSFFIKKNDELIKKDVTIGIANSKQIEVLKGAQEGDQIVISDMERYKDHSSINYSEL